MNRTHKIIGGCLLAFSGISFPEHIKAQSVDTVYLWTLPDSPISEGDCFRIANAFDSAENISSEVLPLLDSLAGFLKNHPQLFVQIKTFSKPLCSNDDGHLRPASKKAERVCAYLIGKGVLNRQLISSGNLIRQQGYVFEKHIYISIVANPEKRGQ